MDELKMLYTLFVASRIRAVTKSVKERYGQLIVNPQPEEIEAWKKDCEGIAALTGVLAAAADIPITVNEYHSKLTAPPINLLGADIERYTQEYCEALKSKKRFEDLQVYLHVLCVELINCIADLIESLDNKIQQEKEESMSEYTTVMDEWAVIDKQNVNVLAFICKLEKEGMTNYTLKKEKDNVTKVFFNYCEACGDFLDCVEFEGNCISMCKSYVPLQRAIDFALGKE